uniref:DNA-directed RNA polymerase subunit omega n=1 Tax=Cryptomonas curvata TaxID=233186 RepID=A0A222AH99_9CRYP|nr:DNA-directed RNA polymerase subunit omega [Cryptomonas curvata]ASO75737.1 DNA-directed RNA polymerase subunit omega [Cryptomonas curvata]
MKKKTQSIPSLEVLYKTEELLDAASNRYRITVQVANKAKRKRYEDINILDDFKLKPVIRAILEIAEEISRPEILTD